MQSQQISGLADVDYRLIARQTAKVALHFLRSPQANSPLSHLNMTVLGHAWENLGLDQVYLMVVEFSGVGENLNAFSFC